MAHWAYNQRVLHVSYFASRRVVFMRWTLSPARWLQIMAFRFILIALSGWMNDRQSLLIDYLREENRVLREQLGGKRIAFH